MGKTLTRREVLAGTAAMGVATALRGTGLSLAEAAVSATVAPLEEFRYDQVAITGATQAAQRQNAVEILSGFGEDSLLQPFLQMAGKPAPGTSLGGWYEWKADYDYHHDDAGFCPGHSLGQWISAMARLDASGKASGGAGEPELRAKALRLTQALDGAITPGFFEQTRFPSYTYDKLSCGLMDAHRLCDDKQAFAVLEHVTDAALPSLPGHAMERDLQWRLGKDPSWMWDEHYTLSENQYLLGAMGAGERHHKLAQTYLLNDGFYEPLARGVNALSDRHAYSHVNSLCSAMQAYFVDGSTMHLRAAVNAFDFLQQQSFATGGWGPEETLGKPGYDMLAKSLTASHANIEVPCGGYAHLKLTRYLLRATRDGKYGDSMERVLLNALLGTMPLQADGHTFYSADYNYDAKRVYSLHRWPCCAGTLPQVVADYGINTYLREHGAVWVNLYQPSELRWNEGGAALALTQASRFPEVDVVRLEVGASKPASFAVNLRVPNWANGAWLQVNGKPEALQVTRGFAGVRRTWKQGDVIELKLPMSLRLEQLPANGGTPQPNVAALMFGPLVLFPLKAQGELGPITASESALLNAERTGAREWIVRSNGADRKFVPVAELGDRSYSLYLRFA